MHKNENCPAHDLHTNAFLDLNGIPYLLGEYLDKRRFQQIDPALIRSEVFIDQRESMRAIIDISIDDIGSRASDGYPAIVGNNTKQRSLLKMISSQADELNHQFDVIRSGIIMRVNYQLENQRTGQMLRSMVENLRIHDRSYFLNINPRNVNDNAIIVNFSNSMVSTINEFTHGRDPMVLRITSVQMFYECLRRDPSIPRIQQANGPWAPGSEVDYYRYHEQMQNRHVITPNGCRYEGFGNESPEMIAPPTWTMISRYYHFDQSGHDIVFHDREINDPMAAAVLVPCGTVQINRAFMINPGHRLVFKFSVWKNDLTVVSDALAIAEAIRTPYFNGCRPPYMPDAKPPYPTFDDCEYVKPYHPAHHHHDGEVLRALRESQEINEQQSQMISRLTNAVNSLREIVSKQHGDDVEVPDVIPMPPNKPPHHKPGHGGFIIDKIRELEKMLEDLKNSGSDSECDHAEIDQKIDDLQKEIEDIRTNGTDEVVADQLKALEEAIVSLQEQVSKGCDHEHPEKIPDDVVNEIVDKIKNS